MVFLKIYLVFALVSSSLSSECSKWEIGTLSGYDNLSDDDKNPGKIAEWEGVTKEFLNDIPVVSIHLKDWELNKYHNINIKSNDVIYSVQSWDNCDDNDCDDCCTENAKKFGGNFLLDVERRTLKKVFGIEEWDNTLEKIQFQICETFDPLPIAEKYHLHQ